ncbi:MAG: site-2 protease family protein [Azoarcus sp.]|jgi:Zn-dependent protease|nr:site-2 protease family protein [Azoarcus sp.]
MSMEILLWVLPVLLAITVHEVAHGYVARHFGDPTAEMAGRITLNPLRHVDLVGTLIVPASLYLLSKQIGIEHPVLFGWAKPVPVNFNRLRHPKADMLWVAAAGPFANLVMAFGWACLSVFGKGAGMESYGYGLWLMALAGMSINGVLLFLNLIPVPPLDGGRIAVSLLPDDLARAYSRLEPFGLFILFGLLMSGALNVILGPLVFSFEKMLMRLVGM